MQQHAADLVAVEQPRAILRHAGDAHAVAVRIRADAQIRAQLFLHFQRQAEGVRLLGVGHAHGGKAPIRQLLLGHDVHVLHADFLQNAAHRNVAGAVQRRVYDLQRRADLARQFGVDGELPDGGDVGIVHLGADVFKQSGVQRGLLVHGQRFGVAGFGQQVGNALYGLGGHLAAVRPVDLIAVIFAGVVAGGNDHARDAAQVPHREREHRHRPQRGEQVRLYARSRQHQRGFAGEHIAHQAGIVGDGHALFCAAGMREDILGQRARHAAHVVFVHAVRACAEHAAHARRTKFEIAVKAILDFGGVVFDGF